MMQKLEIDDEALLKVLPLWSIGDDEAEICREYRFKNFNEAFDWMKTMAVFIKKVDHHPQWLNNWNRVHVVLTTHDVAGITKKDIALAQEMDRLFLLC